MTQVSIERLYKAYAPRRGAEKDGAAVRDVSIEVGDGSMLVLLGPSGCGKSTILRCIAGLERITSGRISIGGRAVSDAEAGIHLDPDRRDLGMVFQNYALWPHLTVARNIGFPLRVRGGGIDAAQAAAMVREMAAMVRCEKLLDRYPSELSGGQQQRVALARALVARPSLILFDEPLSNLDALLRIEMRTELRRLHRELGFTAVYVTHDQEEALAIGDRIAVMRDGALDQIGSPEEVYSRPATEHAAIFLGFSNALPASALAPAALGAGDVVRFRPGHARLVAEGSAAPDEFLLLPGAEVIDQTYLGETSETVAALGPAELKLRHAVASGARPGDDAALAIEAARALVYRDGMLVGALDEILHTRKRPKAVATPGN